MRIYVCTLTARILCIRAMLENQLICIAIPQHCIITSGIQQQNTCAGSFSIEVNSLETSLYSGGICNMGYQKCELRLKCESTGEHPTPHSILLCHQTKFLFMQLRSYQKLLVGIGVTKNYWLEQILIYDPNGLDFSHFNMSLFYTANQ